MKLFFDLTTYQSLGNVQHEDSVDNFESFENAKAFIKLNMDFVEKSISELFLNPKFEIGSGSTITIPIAYHSSAKLMERLEFVVNSTNGDEIHLALINVKLKK